MSDSSGHRRDETAPVEKPWKKDTKNVPPLVWLVIAAVIVIVAVMFFYGSRGGNRPAGLPPAPATDTASAPAASGG
jgi:hypothetical protein